MTGLKLAYFLLNSIENQYARFNIQLLFKYKTFLGWNQLIEAHTAYFLHIALYGIGLAHFSDEYFPVFT